MKIIARRTLQGFSPIYDHDKDAIKKIKIGKDVEIDIKQPRNLKFHKKMFALLNVGFENQEKYETLEIFRYIMTLKAGHFVEVATDKGVVFMPKSMKFSKMDDLVFSDLYSKILDVILKEIGCTSEEIELEILQFS